MIWTYIVIPCSHYERGYHAIELFFSASLHISRSVTTLQFYFGHLGGFEPRRDNCGHLNGYVLPAINSRAAESKLYLVPTVYFNDHADVWLSKAFHESRNRQYSYLERLCGVVDDVVNTRMTGNSGPEMCL